MRAKLFFVMAVALFWSASVFSETIVGGFVTGNSLFDVCSDSHHINEAYCKGYVAGVADAISQMNAVKANGWTTPSTCIPQGEKVTQDQLKDVVVQYLTAHPEIRHVAAAGLTLLALQAAFPCK